jgi:hypothetical protein
MFMFTSSEYNWKVSISISDAVYKRAAFCANLCSTSFQKASVMQKHAHQQGQPHEYNHVPVYHEKVFLVDGVYDL